MIELAVGQVWEGEAEFPASGVLEIVALEATRVKWRDVNRPAYQVWETRAGFGEWAETAGLKSQETGR